MIRPIRASDIPRLRELGSEWEFGEDFIEGCVAVDENDQPVMFFAAWRRAEVHVVVDNHWSTPGARFVLMNEMQSLMGRQLKAAGFTELVTWFDRIGTKAAQRFQRRLQKGGWIMSIKQSWHKGTS